MNTVSATSDRRYAPHNGARILPLPERVAGTPVARSGYDLNHAEPTEPVVEVGHHRAHRAGQGERYGVRVSGYTSVNERRGYPDRDEVYSEVVWSTERYDATVRNRMGRLGAYVSDPPTEELVSAAVARAVAELRAVAVEPTLPLRQVAEIDLRCTRCWVEGNRGPCRNGHDGERCECAYPHGSTVSGGPYVAATTEPLVVNYAAELAGVEVGEAVILTRATRETYPDAPVFDRIRIGVVVDDAPVAGWPVQGTMATRTLVRRRVVCEEATYRSVREARMVLARRAVATSATRQAS